MKIQLADFMRARYPQAQGHLTSSSTGGWMEMRDIGDKGAVFVKWVDENHFATGIEIFHFGRRFVQIQLEWCPDWWRAFLPGEWSRAKIEAGKEQTVRAHMWYGHEGKWYDWVGKNAVIGPFTEADGLVPIIDLNGVAHELEAVILESGWGTVKERYWYARDRNNAAIVWGFIRWDWLERDGEGWKITQGGQQLDRFVPGVATIPDVVWTCKPERTSAPFRRAQTSGARRIMLENRG